MDQHKDQRADNLFKWRQYKGEMTLLCVRWALAFLAVVACLVSLAGALCTGGVLES